jgi:flagellar protein FliS
MTYGKTMARYQKTSVETARDIDLIIMCYEKAIQSLTQAQSHYEKDEFEQKAKKLQKALDIITHLQGCLDFEKGGQIARNLDALYTYMNKRMLETDIKHDPEGFCDVIKIMDELKGAWEEISSQPQTGAADMHGDAPMKTSAAGLAA